MTINLKRARINKAPVEYLRTSFKVLLHISHIFGVIEVKGSLAQQLLRLVAEHICHPDHTLTTC